MARRLLPMIQLALNTGMRPGDVLDLERRNADFKLGRIRLEKTKGSAR